MRTNRYGMKINSKYKIRDVAGEHLIMIHDYKGGLTKVMALNETSFWLWNKLINKDFSENDVMSLLLTQLSPSKKILINFRGYLVSVDFSTH